MGQWSHWYAKKSWRKLRLRVLAEEPLCRMCRAKGRLTPADTVDHIKPHRGDTQLFWDRDNLQALCASCHNSDKQSEERRETMPKFGVDGWPV